MVLQGHLEGKSLGDQELPAIHVRSLATGGALLALWALSERSANKPTNYPIFVNVGQDRVSILFTRINRLCQGFVEFGGCWASRPRKSDVETTLTIFASSGSAWIVFSPLTGSGKSMFALPTSSWRMATKFVITEF